jgi:hypothetical protein
MGLEHKWSFDNLGRKDASGIDVSSSMPGSPASIRFSNDTAVRVDGKGLIENHPLRNLGYAYDWLGMNPIAEEHWGSESDAGGQVFQPDPQTGSKPQGDSWGALQKRWK